MNEKNNIFVLVKEYISSDQAAAYYGLQINRNHMAICPFHKDKNPSMRIEKKYFCFACGARGDVIDYVANLFGISVKEAALKLASDFGIPIDEPLSEETLLRIKEKKAEHQKKQNEQAEQDRFYIVITEYYHLLKHWLICYSPRTPDENYNALFVLAANEIPFIEYVMDCYLQGSFNERNILINQYKGELPNYEKRVKEYREKTGYQAEYFSGLV